ncbi:MAG TPA: cell division protein FtsA [Calditrichia bacterium]|nr:cell division protein FtsA [Calditrichota bacterium]HQU71114.1 cell division protein FtsA [Calditrichia bacterium]HQV33516.1 cell division protein FtsA [Calditrichia bacterium]
MEGKIITGLDIGTTKICAVVVKEDYDGTLNVVGIGSAPSYGLRKGVVVNIDKTVSAVKQAVEEAQTMAGVEVESVFVGIAGDHIRSINSKGMVGVTRDDHEITEEDVERAINAAKALALPIDREIIHAIPQEFIVDDQDGIHDPVGMCGVRLEVEVHIVTAAVTSAQNIVRSVQRAGYDVEEIILEPLASSLAVLNDDERSLGVALVDIGGGTSDIAMFFDGHIQHTSVVALGGQHLTSDIAIGLRTPQDMAEEIKLKYGTTSRESVNSSESIMVPGVGGRAPRTISRSVLVDIVAPRMEEILALTYQKMQKSELLELMAAGAVITGGAALLDGTAELAEKIWELPVRIGVPKHLGGLTASVKNPKYSTAVGLCLYGAEYHNSERVLAAHTEGALWDDVMGSFSTFFKRFF